MVHMAWHHLCDGRGDIGEAGGVNAGRFGNVKGRKREAQLRTHPPFAFSSGRKQEASRKQEAGGRRQE